LKGAGHAVVRTLCSRARRVGLDETSWVLRRPGEDFSLDRLMVVVAALLLQPVLELLDLLEQKLEGLAHNVGLVPADELGVLM